MKNYKNLFLLIPLSLMGLVSCEDDDAGIGQPIIPEQTNATAMLSFDNDEPFYGRGESPSYTATLGAASSVPRQVTVQSQIGSLTTTDLSLALEGASVANGSIEIPEIGPSIDGFDARGEFSAQIIGVRNGEIIIDEDENEVFNAVGGDTVATTSDEATISYFDRTPLANADGLDFLMDWSNPSSNDLDLEVIDAAFTSIFESSASGSRYESDLFDNTRPDGDYVFYITVFDPDNAATLEPISVRFFTVDSQGGKTLFELVLPAGTATGGRLLVAGFTQTTVDGAAEYSDIGVL